MERSLVGELLVLTLASTLIYTKSVFNGHTMDDHPAIEWNTVVLGRKPNLIQALLSTDFWGQDLNAPASHGSFRPLVTAMFRLQAMVTAYYQKGDKNAETAPHPGLLHVVNIFFHWLSTITLYWILKRYLAKGISFRFCKTLAEVSQAFVAAIMFAVHPIHAEAVCGGVGLAEVTCTFVMFLATGLYCESMAATEKNSGYLRQLLLGLATLGLAILAAASKEQGFMLLPMCMLIEFAFIGTNKLSLLRLLFCFSGSLILAGIRLALFGAPRTALFLHFDNPASFQPHPTRHLTYAYLPTFCLWLMLFPIKLCADWGDGTIALVKSFADIRVFVTLFIAIAIFMKTYRTVNHIKVSTIFQNKKVKASDIQYLIALAIFTATFLPSSNLLGPVGFVVAERVLYAPSAGFCLLVAIGFHRLIKYWKNGRNVLVALFVSTCVSLSLRTVVRTFDWESDMTLSWAGLRVSNTNARIFINVGAYLRETTSDCDKALAYFDKAVRLNPRMAKAHFNRARCMRFLIENRREEADAIKQNKPPPKIAKKGLVVSLRQLARGCDFSLQHCILVAKDNIPPNGYVPNHVADCYMDLVNLMTVHGELYLGNLAQTKLTADRALVLSDTVQQLRPDLPRVYISKANLLMAMRRFSEAKAELFKVKKIDPGNLEVIRALAWILAEKENRDGDAVHFYHEALEINPKYEIAAIELAKIVIRSKLVDYYPIALYRLSEIKATSKAAEVPVLIKQLKSMLAPH